MADSPTTSKSAASATAKPSAQTAPTSTTASVPTTSTQTKTDPGDAVVRVQEALAELRDAMLDTGMDEATVDAKLHAAQPSGLPSLVGNFADLQRLGGMLVGETGDIADAIKPPAGISVEEAGVATAAAGVAAEASSPSTDEDKEK